MSESSEKFGKIEKDLFDIYDMIKELTNQITFSESTKHPNNFRRGDYVEHEKFGKGVVLDLNDSGENTKAKIMFKNFGTKTIIAKFLKRV